MSKAKILLIYTGGTIGMIKDYKTNALKAFDFSQIVEKIPELEQLNCTIKTISFDKPIDSSNMDTSYYVAIVEIIEANYKKNDGFVILTGSDTMSYTSSAISFMLENLQKPIIFTGSQLPIGYLRTDAKENLITSIEIACARKNNKPIISEVCLYFEYKLYRANRTTKINAEQFEAFISMNYPPLAESGVHLKFNEHVIHQPKKETELLIVRKKMVSDVVILKLFPGINESTAANILSASNIRGVIMESYGSGNVPHQPWFLELLAQTIESGVVVLNVSQCNGGTVVQGKYEASSSLEKIGVVSGRDLTIEAATTKMMYALGRYTDVTDIKNCLTTPVSGEIN